jgi:hypothetical protein
MQIHFETHNDGPEAAKGLVAALVAIYGDSVLPNNVVTTGISARPVTLPATSAPAVTSSPAVIEEADSSPPAVDAATAFGASPVVDAATAFGVQLDKQGVPWDERIHSSTKAITAKGEWQRRRNTPDETFDTILGELKAQYSGQVPPPPASAPTVTSVAPSQTVAAAAASLTVPASTDDEPLTFVKIMMKTMNFQREGKITSDGVSNLLKSVGAADMVGLKDDATRKAFNALLDDHVSMNGG